MYDKKSAKDVIESYRRRKQMAEQIPLLYGIAVALLIIGATYFVYRVINSGLLPLALPATETAAPSETPLPADTPTPTPPPAEPPVSLIGEEPLSAEPATGADTSVYTVTEGDTLGSIMAQYDLTMQAILDLNPGLDPDFLTVGQEIILPSAGSANVQASTGAASPQDSGQVIEHQVVAGDTLASIALRYNTTVDALMAENNLENPDVLLVGILLRIPAGDTGVTAADTPAQPEPTQPLITGVVPAETSQPAP
jgi:LysM repeat protein